MFTLTRRIGVSVLFGLVVWGLRGSEARAQENPYFRMGGMGTTTTGGGTGLGGGISPYTGPNPIGTMSSSPTAGLSWSRGAFNSPWGYPPIPLGGTFGSYPYSPYSPYSPYYPYSPYGGWFESLSVNPDFGGYLSGSASVINAQGNFMVSAQQSRLIKEQVSREKWANRLRVFEEWLYEREKTPTRADEQARFDKVQLGMARLGSDLGAISSGKALNDLLKHLDKVPENAVPAGQFTLNEDVLNKINVSPPLANGNSGLLKNEGKLSWPQALMGADFKEVREKLNSLLPDAIRQAAAESKVGNTSYTDIDNAVKAAYGLLQQKIKDMPLNQFNDGKRFLNQLEDGVKILAQPDVGKYFNGEYTAKGQTVPDLIKNMKKNGLKFKPATGGDDAAYFALFQALLAYDMATQSQLAAEPKPPEK